ncbi:hypothetical protein [Staphylococcus equorum]|uniref:hypothetical protein n=2 Tax=Staphylococcus equorum TaxID=246432 RepID=UPI0021C14291|nr:hypothetical protein [Staphylococcus equorum]
MMNEVYIIMQDDLVTIDVLETLDEYTENFTDRELKEINYHYSGEEIMDETSDLIDYVKILGTYNTKAKIKQITLDDLKEFFQIMNKRYVGMTQYNVITISVKIYDTEFTINTIKQIGFKEFCKVRNLKLYPPEDDY